MINNNDRLMKLQKRELEIAKEIKRVCDKNDIKYTLSSGSALGAVRHKGFIPWDDDMDFAMLRSEYEKFIQIAPKELNNNYYLQTMDNEENYSLTFAKVRDKNSKIIEGYSKNVKLKSGIWVDIFPYDNAADDYSERKKDYKFIKTINSFLTIKIGYRLPKMSFVQFIEYYIIKFITLFISTNRLKKTIKKRMLKHNNCTTNNVVFYGGNYKMIKGTLPRKIFNEYTKIKFEDTEFNIFKDNKYYLKHVYGDYMKLPPENKRNNFHGIISLEIGNEIL